MKKSLKMKLLAGTTAVAVLSGAGFALANTDAGTALQAWYKGDHDTAVKQMTRETAMYGGVKSVQAGKFVVDQGKKVNKQIADTRDSEINSKTTNMSNASAAHIASLNAQYATIMDGMDADFDTLYNQYSSFIGDAAEKMYNASNDTLNSLAQTRGTEAKTKVEADLNAAKNSAVTDLSTAITTAKNDISAKLAENKSTTTQELKDFIDERYNTLTAQLEQVVNEYIAAQQTIIQSAADSIQQSAYDDMDALVNEINN